MSGSTRTRYPGEVRERAVNLVLDHQADYPTQWAAISSIAGKSGMTREMSRRWVPTFQIELVEEVSGTIWTADGPGRLHHLGYWAFDLEAESEELSRSGSPL